MVGKLTSVENGPERNVKLTISADEVCSEISSPSGSYKPHDIVHYEVSGLQEHDHGLITLTFVLANRQKVRFYSTYSKFDMALLLDQLDATIGERRREAVKQDSLTQTAAAIPWEEDPRYQEANYRLLVHVVVISTALATIYGLTFREWSFVGVWYSALGVLLGGLCIYGALVFSVGHTVRFLSRVVLRAFRRRRPKC